MKRHSELSFDVIVVGGGHAGVEAAAAAARGGCRTALLCQSLGSIGAMSCNPAIGGLGKGQLIGEVDALDGLMGVASDAAAIHYRMLNSTKGPAVQGPRVQADRRYYAAAIQRLLAATPGLQVIATTAEALAIERGAVAGIRCADGLVLRARAVVLATGTFLNGRIYRGTEVLSGGRAGEPAATALGDQLRELSLAIGRMKTGTPPRLDGRTIDWAKLAVQPSDTSGWTMSPLGRRTLPQLHCALTRTNLASHDIIRAALTDSPLTSGAIQASGPRYCPSVEDKVRRFGDREGHQVFLEPEGLDTNWIYPNGLSTSLDVMAQQAMVASVAGLERARIVEFGYAIEYDHLDPRALDHSLGLASLPGMFCAGQINGTTGYEEAAAQGVVAGLNAGRYAAGLAPIVFERDNSYLGVLIDDLVLQGVTEPYRMLTSRAEHRLKLRCDNAATRLTPIGIAAGIVGSRRRQWWQQRERELHAARRGGHVEDPSVVSEVRIDRHYAPFLARQQRENEQVERNDALRMPTSVDWYGVSGLSTEMIFRLTAARPKTLGEVRRIRGITPAAVVAVMLATRRQNG